MNTDTGTPPRMHVMHTRIYTHAYVHIQHMNTHNTQTIATGTQTGTQTHTHTPNVCRNCRIEVNQFDGIIQIFHFQQCLILGLQHQQLVDTTE